MPSTSTNIPNCQPPATNAEGVMAVTPNAGGGVAPLLLDSNGIPLQLDDYVVLQEGRTGKIVSMDRVRGAFVVLCERNFFYLDFKHGTSLRLARRYRPADVTATESVVPYTPDLIDTRKLAAFCNALIRVDVRHLGRDDLFKSHHDKSVESALGDKLAAIGTLRVLALFAEKRRIDAAAAHAMDMQSGGVAHD